MPIQQMHAGEEILYFLIPAFIVLMVIDVIKRKRIRRRREESPDEGAPVDEPPGPPSP